MSESLMQKRIIIVLLQKCEFEGETFDNLNLNLLTMIKSIQIVYVKIM
jgi:hypothetical protein